ncbi:hypothetical protein NliqN6_0752 [Naganishia liquefaciens]|uniref:molybdopterin adenylyltransferase n=1 Tax=Naganishia liquefaciens TaxID=104408 RepID=A0A8H3TNJ6_9TREE|nr:hypothetical protein NliqN6_0752 [Naganishia liquefaciens]
MSSFTQATAIIDDFVRTFYPPTNEDVVGIDSPSSSPPTQIEPPPSPQDNRRNVPLLSALGQVSCCTIQAPLQMPLFDNSAMDGYAIRSWQTADASPANPLTFRVLGSIAAGDEPPVVPAGSDPSERTCWAIMTGAAFPVSVEQHGQPVVSGPDRYDACVKLELVTARYAQHLTYPESITLTSVVGPEANRRRAGEDIHVGDVLLQQGEVVRKEHVMVLASMGIQALHVSTRPATERQHAGRRLRIGILNTGKEVVLNLNSPTAPDDDSSLRDPKPDPTLSPWTPAHALPTPPSSRSPSLSSLPRARAQLGVSQIWNSNGPYIHASLLTWGFPQDDIDVLPIRLLPGQDGDDPAAFQATVRAALAAPYDVLISTGGVSTGVHDYVPASIAALGGEIGFHKIQMRPGGPMMFAHMGNGRRTDAGAGAGAGAGGRTAYFGLPGNPVAAAVCLRFLVGPALVAMRAGGGDDHGLTLPRGRTVRIRAEESRHLANNVVVVVQRKPALSRMYVAARVCAGTRGADDRDGVLEVEALARGSNMTRALTRADGWVCFPEGEARDTVYDGDLVEWFSLDL